MQLHDSGLVGNSRTSAIIDSNGRIVWWCFPVFDSHPLCHAMASPCCCTKKTDDAGFIDVLFGKVRSKDQYYIRNTPVLVTRFADNAHNVIETVDFSPCYIQYGRLFTPPVIVRIIRRIAGRPRIAIRIRPCLPADGPSQKTIGANHVTFKGGEQDFRVTTDASITALLEEQAFYLEDSITLVMGMDQALETAPKTFGQSAYEATIAYWHGWIHNISIPLEWQDEVIRAAITLRLNTFYDTGAIVAGHGSLDESCQQPSGNIASLSWVRDACSVTGALNRLGATGTMERYLRYLLNVIADSNGLPFQAVYDIHHRTVVSKNDSGIWEIPEHHDSYGAAVLACTQAFFDGRLYHPADRVVFEQLERLGETAFEKFRQPDLDIWGYGETAIHTYSSMMCWAACDRLSRIAAKLDLPTQAKEWAERAGIIHGRIIENAWNQELKTFTATWEGDAVDASLLRMIDLHFLPADDERVIKTVNRITEKLLQGDFLLCSEKAVEAHQENLPFISTFWWILAINALGRKEQARDAFERILSYQNYLGMFSSCVSCEDRSLSGVFPSTSAMVGVIQCAVALSKPWDNLY
ncbi:MAG: glycoside hydrolase family 15 protein [Oxalobacter sp.]|nr:glycoside hydrolase family 15 protein [Oxalobacter sp.]